MSDVVVVERRGPVVIARLNRPEARNAFNAETMRQIGAVINEAESTPDIRAVVLTGTGDKAFCAGMDLRAFSGDEMKDLPGDPDASGFYRLMDGAVTVPLVGAVNATALAGGFELLLACDVIVASSEATFGLPEVKRGLFPGGTGTFAGTRMALGVALEMTLTGDPISAQRAYEVGFVNAVVPPAEVLETAIGFAERIAANGPLAVAAVKELVRLGVNDATRARERLDVLRTEVFNSADAKEGALAFIEKRTPVWQGR